MNISNVLALYETSEEYDNIKNFRFDKTNVVDQIKETNHTYILLQSNGKAALQAFELNKKIIYLAPYDKKNKLIERLADYFLGL